MIEPNAKFGSAVVAFFIFCHLSGMGQVKIGDNPSNIDANSILEVESTDKGVLLPRVSLNSTSSASPLTAPVPEGMLVYSDGGSLSDGYYYWTGSAWTKISNENSRNNFVLAKSESDLPAPSGGIITLASGSVYEINGTITTSNKIDLNGSYLIGQNANVDGIVYTGSAEMFTGTKGGTVKIIGLTAASGKVFNIDATSNPGSSMLVRDVIISGSAEIGLLKGFNITFFDVVSCVSNTTGIRFENDNYLF